ncbi:hypothetical protein DPMN_155395 [Dreissena polymorpha]|uniref:Uncharacterized protein n=1 Tax=Dreissena polymorpha TaxID=45954 RepID=A0A9D4FQ97_DREPO|nr:hypothetical protein DPMN_155395 [Dreissena polymorpha]
MVNVFAISVHRFLNNAARQPPRRDLTGTCIAGSNPAIIQNHVMIAEPRDEIIASYSINVIENNAEKEFAG